MAILFEDYGPLQGPAVWNPSSNTDDDGAYNNYSKSNMRTTALPAVLATYPSDLQDVINTTSYKVATNGNNGTILTLQDKLFLGAMKEYFGVRYGPVQAESDVLSQFALYAANNTDEFRIKYNASKNATPYALRSPQTGNKFGGFTVNSSGVNNTISGGVGSYVSFSPLFTVGVLPN